MRIFVFTLILFITVPAAARWATKEDAIYKVNFERRTITIRKDASATTIVERQIEILKDQARVDQGLMRISYDGTTSQFRVLKAYTINGDKEKYVAAKDIETKPLASSGPGFDVINQVTIAFPDVKVGSKLYIKSEEVESRSRIPELFLYHTHLYGEWLEEFSLRFKSEIPLYVHRYDPEDRIDIKAEGKELQVQLKSEYWKLVSDELYGLPDPQSVLWFAVTSIKSWSDFPQGTLQTYESDLKSGLPEKFENIFQTAKQQRTDIDKINAVTSELAEAVRYVGDWRALEGIYHPRTLDTIAQTGFGDCKDYSVSTAAILRRLGFEANVAWIARGTKWFASPLSELAMDANHAIVFAKKGGREYWIDPTNVTSFAQGAYPDIADRTALVLYPNQIQVKRTPKLKPEESTTRINNEVRYINRTQLEARGSIEMLGGSALRWTAYELSSTKANRDFQMIGWITPVDNVIGWKFDDLDLRTRIVRDLKTNFNYKEMLRPIPTTAGEGHILPKNNLIALFKVRREERVSDVIMDDPATLEVNTHLTGRRVCFDKPIHCEGKSKWADYSRDFKKSGNGYVMKDRYSLKVPILKATEMKTDEFAKFQSNLLNCMLEAVVVFK